MANVFAIDTVHSVISPFLCYEPMISLIIFFFLHIIENSCLFVALHYHVWKCTVCVMLCVCMCRCMFLTGESHSIEEPISCLSFSISSISTGYTSWSSSEARMGGVFEWQQNIARVWASLPLLLRSSVRPFLWTTWRWLCHVSLLYSDLLTGGTCGISA